MADTTRSRQADPARTPRNPVPGLLTIFSEDGAPLPPVHAVRNLCVVGRGEDADLQLADDTASRRHVEAQREGAHLRLCDLGSRNGSHFNGRALGADMQRAEAGGVLRVGGTLLLVVADAARYRGIARSGGRTGLVGGPALGDLRRAIADFAPTRLPVLLEGEPGTGKEVAARAFHTQSARTGAWVPVNCAALPQELMESELFGHLGGAFSGAQRAREGLFRRADGGTLFLDEIGELAAGAQAKLLRVLESGELRPVGADAPQQIDVRVVAATNQPLRAMVDDGRFRGDLYDRLAGVRVRLPPLREHLEDLPALAEHFLAASEHRPSAVAMERLLTSDWPGNVRALRHSLQAALARCESAGVERIELEHLPPIPTSTQTAPVEDPDTALRVRIETALSLRRGNVAQVARDLGMRRAGLYEAFARLGIDPARYRD